MPAEELKNAFLDRQLLRLDEGALSFVFGKERVEQAQALSKEEAEALVKSRKEDVKDLMVDVSRRIVIETFYDKLFEELAEVEADLAKGFIALALNVVHDEDIEAARAKAVSEASTKRPKEQH
ncbi:MAG: hypothetical protein ACYTDT_00255 [Planctomycetota bacterium]|jgi:hypothetical protein